MKLITSIYPTNELDVSLVVQSRQTKGNSNISEPLVTRYRSKIGNESLIFNPSIVILIRSRTNSELLGAMIPLNLIYRFTASLTAVYQSLQSDKMFREEGDNIYIDSKLSLKNSRKLSLFKASLTMMPCVVTVRSGKSARGIVFTLDGATLGTMTHTEVLGLLDILDHLDVATFSLLAGVVDELESMNGKVDMILNKLTNIENILTNVNTQNRPASTCSRMNWQTLDNIGII